MSQSMSQSLIYTPTKTIALTGMMGCGKTVVGRALADYLDVPFTDLDQEIETTYKSTISQIFDRFGEAFFRDCETRVIEQQAHEPIHVLSLGGGTFNSEHNRDILARYAVSVFLYVPLDVLWQRLSTQIKQRPLLDTDDPYSVLAALYQERLPIYQKANVQIPIKAQHTVDHVVDLIIEALVKDLAHSVHT